MGAWGGQLWEATRKSTVNKGKFVMRTEVLASLWIRVSRDSVLSFPSWYRDRDTLAQRDFPCRYEWPSQKNNFCLVFTSSSRSAVS